SLATLSMVTGTTAGRGANAKGSAGCWHPNRCASSNPRPGRRALVVRNYSTEVRFPVESNDMWQVVEYSPLKYPHYPDKTVGTRVNLVNLGNAPILTIPGEALPNIGFYLKRQMRG